MMSLLDSSVYKMTTYGLDRGGGGLIFGCGRDFLSAISFVAHTGSYSVATGCCFHSENL